jgi:hypothetical protein
MYSYTNLSCLARKLKCVAVGFIYAVCDWFNALVYYMLTQWDDTRKGKSEVAPFHAMTAYGGRQNCSSTSPWFKWTWVGSLTAQPLSPRERNPDTHLRVGRAGPRARCTEIEPRMLILQLSHYTDCAIPFVVYVGCVTEDVQQARV